MGFLRDLFGPRSPCDLCHLGEVSWPSGRSASADWVMRGGGLHASLFICAPCRTLVYEWDLDSKMPIFALARMVAIGHAVRPSPHAYLQHPEWRKIWMHMLEVQNLRPADDFAALTLVEDIERKIMEAEALAHSAKVPSPRPLPPYRHMVLRAGLLVLEEEARFAGDPRPTKEILLEAFEDYEERRDSWTLMKCLEVITRDPTEASGHYLLGVCLFRRGFFEEAVTALKEATRLAPTEVPMLSSLAKAQRLVDPMSVRETYERVLRLDPQHAEARQYCGLSSTDDDD